MKFRSVFDIIGPIMIGPSSSHTAGAARIGRVARTIFNRQPSNVTITLYGSFAKTYRGHGTDVALVGGLLDFDTFDERIRDAFAIAKNSKMEIEFIESEEDADHPNTARIRMHDEFGTTEVVGISIGGGKIEIIELDGFVLKMSGNHPALFVVHEDRFGMIAAVANVLAKHEINICQMEVSRKAKGHHALMAIETDQKISDEIVKEINSQPHMISVAMLNP